ncbi:MAG: O-antigen ligase family protein [Chloroflexi bacterium]|nr:O-antigen ligase family protein [Chloroflexota bacterium]
MAPASTISSRTGIVLLLIITALPLWSHPQRYIEFEPHRGAVLILLLVFGLRWADVRPALTHRTARPLQLAIALWAAALTLSTALAIAPSQAFFGDLFRSMGWLTQIALLGAFVLGSTLPAIDSGRFFWLSGIAVAVIIFSQFLGLLPDPDAHPLRAAGPLGSASGSASWLALSLAWAGSHTVFAWKTLGARRERTLHLLGLGIMGTALILTGSRGATIALAAGCVTGALLCAALFRRRWPMVAVVLVLAVSGSLGFLLSRLGEVPLFSRLSDADSTIAFRFDVWSQTLDFFERDMRLDRLHGVAVPIGHLRALVGYGPESFETVYAFVSLPTPATSNQRIDRAHNDWLDTLIANGLLGVAARAALWLAIAQVAFRRLGLASVPAWGAIGCGAALAGMLARDTAWMPAAMTGGAILGSWAWLLIVIIRRQKVIADRAALLALVILTIHLVDLQFVFVKIANTLPAMIAFGLLLRPPERERVHQDREKPAPARWGSPGDHITRIAPILAAIVLRQMVATASNPLLPILLATLTLLVLVLVGRGAARRYLLSLATFSFYSILGGLLLDPSPAAFWDIGLLVAALTWIGGLRSGRKLGWPRVAAMVIGLSLWWAQAASDIRLRDVVEMSDPAAQSINALAAALLRPYDYRLWGAAAAYTARVDPIENTEVWEALATALGEKALDLNPYDPNCC